jgi:hypothetical protein
MRLYEILKVKAHLFTSYLIEKEPQVGPLLTPWGQQQAIGTP